MKALILCLVAVSVFASIAFSQEKKVVCYFGTWAGYRPEDGAFNPENIDPFVCTHILYSFVGADENTGKIKLLDPYNDLPDDYGNNFIGRTNDLKKKNPNLKTVVSYGGWNEGSTEMSHIANDPNLRKAFAKNAAAFAKKYNFDGFDVDWEYPAQRGGADSDKEAFVELLKEMRSVFDTEGLTLSAAVAAGKTSIDTSYDVPGISKYLDWITVMAFDLHGDWDSTIGENAPLNPGSADESDLQKTLNVKFAINYWISLGAPPEKIVMGMGTYGRSFTIDAKHHNVGDPASGAGQPGPWTEEAGTLGYNEICLDILNNGWTEVWNEEQEVPYAYKGNQWVGYDNPRSLAIKTTWGLSKNLGGFMVWSIDTDDFLGKCKDGPFPLMHAINDVIQGKTTLPWSSTSTTTAISSIPPEETTTEKNSGTEECTAAGFFRNENDCHKFYECVQSGDGFLKYEFSCPDGTIFDDTLHICEAGTC